MDPREQIAASSTRFATDEAAGKSALYVELAHHVAGDPDTLALDALLCRMSGVWPRQREHQRLHRPCTPTRVGVASAITNPTAAALVA